MKYTCASCQKHGCKTRNMDNVPKNCPTANEAETLKKVEELYNKSNLNNPSRYKDAHFYKRRIILQTCPMAEDKRQHSLSERTETVIRSEKGDSVHILVRMATVRGPQE